MQLKIFVFCAIIFCANAEHFSSTEEFRVVLDAQKLISQELRKYIAGEEERLDKIKRLAAEYERDSVKSEDEIVKFIGNPVNAYLVAKRFQQERVSFQDLIPNTDFAKRTFERLEPYRKMLPTEEDFHGTMLALMRLQDTYALPPSALADGIVPDAANSTRLTAADCFEIGRLAYMNRDYYHTIHWMQEALDRLRFEPGTTPTIDKVPILDHLSYAVYMQGNMKLALRMTEEILKIKPDHERALKNKGAFEYNIKLKESAKLHGDTGDNLWTNDETTFKNERVIDEYRKQQEFQYYEQLCRGETPVKIKNPHKLYCDYATNSDPRLLIAPLKRETVHLDPWIMMYHDVISDEEIKFIKDTAMPRMNRATVHNSATGQLEPAAYRISKTAWLKNDTDKRIIPRLLNRVTAMTQLNLEQCEEFQVSNYGIGGQYEPHYDFARPEEEKAFDPAKGNRFATVLYYLTDIPAGGSTVFTSLGVHVKAKKGAAAVWYNLKLNGDGDMRTRHAACPVLVGNKWVLNKWYHIRGNEFWHPCGLTPDDYFTPEVIEKAKPTYHRAMGRHKF